MDDTNCVNRYQMPLLPICGFDCNQRRQLISFSIIADQGENSFVVALQVLKLYVNEVKCFIIDRLVSQRQAIQAVFPSSFIIFCRRHLKKNIIDTFGRSSLIYKAFNDLIEEKVSDIEYKRILAASITMNKGHKKAIKQLIIDLPHYSPTNLKKYNLRELRTTNAI